MMRPLPVGPVLVLAVLSAPAVIRAQGVGDLALARAVDRCQKTIDTTSRNVVAASAKALHACAERLFACVQLQGAAPACIAKAEGVCAKETERALAFRAKALVALEKRCGEAAIPFDVLRGPTGADLDELAPACADVLLPSVFTRFGDYAACLLRMHQCQAEDLVGRSMPRVAEILAVVGRALRSDFCPVPAPTPTPTPSSGTTPTPTPVATGPTAVPTVTPALFNRVFVTSTSVPGDFGGLAAADAICAARAAEVGLPGTFVAWLSDATTDAVSRLGGARGFVRLDGAAFADTVADLVAGRIFVPLRIDERGIDVGTKPVWTGTGKDGLAAASRCSDWTTTSGGGLVGYTQGGPTSWTTREGSNCTTPRRLYCFQIDRATPVAPAPRAGKLAFVTSGNFTPGSDSGLAAADLLCQTEATTAGRPGTFRALLASTTASAISRFAVATAYVRPDGVLVASGTVLAAGGVLNSGLWQLANGVYGNNNNAWTGAVTPGQIGTPRSTCDDWSSPTSTAGIGGATTLADVSWFDAFATGSCATGFKVYCLED